MAFILHMTLIPTTNIFHLKISNCDVRSSFRRAYCFCSHPPTQSEKHLLVLVAHRHLSLTMTTMDVTDVHRNFYVANKAPVLGQPIFPAAPRLHFPPTFQSGHHFVPQPVGGASLQPFTQVWVDGYGWCTCLLPPLYQPPQQQPRQMYVPPGDQKAMNMGAEGYPAVAALHPVRHHHLHSLCSPQ